MQSTTRTLFLLSFAYIIVFSLASFTSLWWLQCIFEILAISITLYLSKKTLFGQSTPQDYDFTFSAKSIPYALLLLPILALGVIGISKGTSYITSQLGIAISIDYGTSFWQTLLTSVIISSVVEELFCRYIFLKYLTIYSKRGAIILSALFFAFLHGNLDQFFYAFYAGLILGALACMTNSILPGIVLHLCNNFISLLLIFFPEKYSLILIILLAWLVVSILLSVLLRNKIVPKWKSLFEEETLSIQGMTKQFFLSPLLLFFILFTAEAVLRIIG